jgi:hypothetical protein
MFVCLASPFAQVINVENWIKLEKVKGRRGKKSEVKNYTTALPLGKQAARPFRELRGRRHSAILRANFLRAERTEIEFLFCSLRFRFNERLKKKNKKKRALNKL